MVHADTGGFKPQNWMTPPTVIEVDGDRCIVVRKRAGATEDRLDIAIEEVLSDVTHDMGEAAALEKDGVEAHLQELLAEQPHWCGEGFRLVRREWPTDIGPVDLMCRDDEDGWVAVEIKRVGDDRGGRAAHPLPGAHPRGPGDGRVRGVLAAQQIKPRPASSPSRAGWRASRSISPCCAASAARSDAVRLSHRCRRFQTARSWQTKGPPMSR